MLLSDLLKKLREASGAADQAKQMGLTYKGFGRWADPRTDKITHKTDGDRLTKVDPTQTKLGLDDPSVEKDPGRKAGKDAETQARWKEKTARHGAPSERETREKRFARREQTKDTVKDIADQIHNHDWTHDYSDDPSARRSGAQEKIKLIDTIAKSGFTYSQTKQIFRKAGGKTLKHGGTVAGETFTTNDWRDVLNKRIAISKRVQRGVKGEKPVPPAPTKWDDEKYDSGYMITRSPGYQSLQKKVPDEEDRIPSQPPGHASDVADLAFKKTGDEELARLSRQLSPEKRADLERWLDDPTPEEMPDFKQMAIDDPRDPDPERKFDVKYAKHRQGKITQKSFKTADDAKDFLSKQQKDGMKGIISVAGKPVAQSGRGMEIKDIEPEWSGDTE
jgi:AraC-like DNA-binding protein